MTTKATPVSKPEESTPPSMFTDTLKIALYSQFGGRKTLQIGSLIDAFGREKVLIVSAEHGLNTIRSKVDESKVVEVRNMAELRRNWPRLEEHAKAVGRDGWICVDGMSQITEWLANDQLAGADRVYIASKLNQNIATDDQQFTRFIQRGEINTMAIYGKVGRDSENLLSSLIGMPCNIYANYLEDKTGSSGFERTLPWGPDVPGKVGLKAVMSSFDYVGRLTYNDKGELVASFDPTNSNYFMARTRDDHNVFQVPKVIEKFDLAEFAAMVNGKGGGDAETATK